METLNHNAMRLKLLNQTVLGLMARIEDRTGKMFHELDKALEVRCIETMDSKNVAKLHKLIQDLEDLESKT